MLGSHVLSDLQINELSVPTQLSWGHTHFQTVLQSPTSDLRILKRRQLALFALRHKDGCEQTQELRESLQSLQSVTAIVDELGTDQDPRILETIEQIYWNPASMGAILNDKKLVVSSLVFWKTLLLPTIAVLIPLLAIVLPFFILRHFHGANISASEYMSHLRNVLLKQITIPPILRAKHEADMLGHMFETAFIGLTAFTYISGIWSQVTAAIHLRSIATGLREKGENIEAMLVRFEGMIGTLRNLPERQQRALGDFCLRGEKILADLSDLPRGCGYRMYGYLWNNSACLVPLKEWLGELDALLAIAGLRGIAFPRYGGALEIVGVYHPSLASEEGIEKLNRDTTAVQNAVTNTVSWSPRSHAILTGPNRGGKSTLCKAIGVSLLCAQSWGYAYAERMTLTPFSFLETALHPSDQLGTLSLFEAEIEFAKSVLQRAKTGQRVFVMMDEIFHSTNARDGLAASRVFLSQLFAEAGVTSLISTHYKELPADYAKEVLAWAMDATEVNGRLQYSYKLIPGISEKSSVMEILEERGLVRAVS
jgi:hypothetical protein